MILFKDTIENIKVEIEIDETKDHYTWAGCPTLKTETGTALFEAVDTLTVIKALKNSNTIEEFEEAVEDTWSKKKLAKPIRKQLNSQQITEVQKEAIAILEDKFTDENKYLFDFNKDDETCLYPAFMHYAENYNGRFDKLTSTEQVNYLVESALADC